MNKEELKTHFISLQADRVAKMEAAVSSYNEAKDLDESDTLDSEDYSHQTESGDLAQQLQMQHGLEKDQLDVLKSMKTQPNSKVELGALVQLGDMWIYVSVSGSAFEFNGRKVQPISTLAPIYADMRGKAVGEMVETKSGPQQIKDII